MIKKVLFVSTMIMALPFNSHAEPFKRYVSDIDKIFIEYNQSITLHKNKGKPTSSSSRIFIDYCNKLKSASLNRKFTAEERLTINQDLLVCLNDTKLSNQLYNTDVANKANIAEFINEQKAEGESGGNDIVAENEFMGLNWGLGFGWSFSDSDIIVEAEVVNGVVHATKNIQQQPRIVLEFHKYFWCKSSLLYGCGPFVAVSATESNLLSGVGIGLMFGARNTKADTEGFSIGVGAIMDGDVTSLANGFTDGQPLPPGETEIRYISESRWSALVFVTRTF